SPLIVAPVIGVTPSRYTQSSVHSSLSSGQNTCLYRPFKDISISATVEFQVSLEPSESGFKSNSPQLETHKPATIHTYAMYFISISYFISYRIKNEQMLQSGVFS